VALVRPITADPLVLSRHAPYLIGCLIAVAWILFWARALGRAMGASLVVLSLVYLALNVSRMWR
jgi:hypothetical protein